MLRREDDERSPRDILAAFVVSYALNRDCHRANRGGFRTGQIRNHLPVGISGYIGVTQFDPPEIVLRIVGEIITPRPGIIEPGHFAARGPIQLGVTDRATEII